MNTLDKAIQTYYRQWKLFGKTPTGISISFTDEENGWIKIVSNLDPMPVYYSIPKNKIYGRI